MSELIQAIGKGQEIVHTPINPYEKGRNQGLKLHQSIIIFYGRLVP